jgi:hypothetical protein
VTGTVLGIGLIVLAMPFAAANQRIGIAPHPHAPKGSAISRSMQKRNGTLTAANKNAVVSTLRQAHALLAVANRDYAGHRAKAAESISHAIRELGGGHHHYAHSTTIGAAHHVVAGVAGGGKVHEAQVNSDAQLKQAGQLLASLQGQVPNTHKAAAHVQHAINELNLALKVR